MSNKSQRLRITEKGWGNYNGYFGGVEFVNSLSVETVDPVIATRLGSLIRMETVDTGEQAGLGADMQRTYTDRATVIPESPRGSETERTPVAASDPKYTREDLETEADKHGIAGLRAIAEPIGVRGRGINELIEGIVQAQALV